MRQLTLDLLTQPAPSLDNFVAGPNIEALSALQALASGDRSMRRVHLWGETASGKTHLLRALSHTPLGPHTPLEAFTLQFEGAREVVVVDDCDHLDDARQQALFQCYNRVLAEPALAIVTTSRQAPIALTLRPELRSRLGSGLVIELRALSDAEREHALRQAALRTGAHCVDEVYRYLLTRKARDMRSLLGLFSALDRYALERQRAITLALIREFEALAASTPAGDWAGLPTGQMTPADKIRPCNE